REGKGVFTANLSVEKTWRARILERADPLRRGRFQKLCQRRDRWYGNMIGPAVEPGDPFGGVGERSIEDKGTFRRQQSLEACNVLKVVTEYSKPADHSIARNATQC